jgi:hypothetical protein
MEVNIHITMFYVQYSYEEQHCNRLLYKEKSMKLLHYTLTAGIVVDTESCAEGLLLLHSSIISVVIQMVTGEYNRDVISRHAQVNETHKPTADNTFDCETPTTDILRHVLHDL